MIDHYYAFDSAAQAHELLGALDMTYTDEEGVTHGRPGSPQYALCEVGNLTDSEGVEHWCINIRVIDRTLDLSSLAPWEVFPAQPVCVWA